MCIRSDLKSRATVDPVFKVLSFLGVSQAHFILTLLLHGDLQPVVYTELILNIVAFCCPTHLDYISVDFCWLLICFHYRILDWLWDHVCARHAQKGIMGNMCFVYCQYLRYRNIWIFALCKNLIDRLPFNSFNHWIPSLHH